MYSNEKNIDKDKGGDTSQELRGGSLWCKYK